MNKPKYYLILSGIATTGTLIFSWLSLGKLKSIGINDYDTLLLVFRITNVNILILSLAVLFLIIYFWRQNK